ncbi:GDP-L-fucose synthase (plasmid) [Bradyrhizobium sp. ISRA443]|uniref:GDP-L-fucose synthase family protein n=1 Tax=unclassified Bradyrhizobium TaxID=2631580 RepID=UPI002479605E|nr:MULTISPECIES: GDP-L-fucose synthase [unclassified Bradyrhizobium]WGR90804.1 GDP-L-fucose synthase [Bradyrhizobium sp. ISRA435]WGS03065.1 GDP-L-fucose synthase [Bradyrhizobium sp. ISRA436]WGS09901.1 GDP-L-fucose synthase [Bradyrhizobium sp. ISRA437]WGS16786.1 GDP-L-fucose synthase [Bradyrhizobium sp. ISRA443]
MADATPIYSLAGKRVFVSGHKGMVGSALVRRLVHEHCEVLTVARSELDLRRQSETETWLECKRPDVVVIAAARVGGILANDSYPAGFLYDNLMIEANLIRAAHLSGVEKLLFLGSSCVYPRLARQPITEDALLAGPLEPTNQWYAVAKIAGIKLCQAYRREHGNDFISAMPTNLYGPGDNYDEQSSHVMPALICKTHTAKVAGAGHIAVWGSGRPRREFLYVDDLADALVFILTHYSADPPINIGTGVDMTIRELADLVCEIVGFKGVLRFDETRPDGTPRKLLDVSQLSALGWRPRTDLRAGVAAAYRDYVARLTVSSQSAS